MTSTNEFEGIQLEPGDPTSIFRVVGVVGRGAFGAVIKAQKASGELVAVKMLSLGPLDDSLQDVKREISLLQRCAHPNVVKYLGTYKSRDELWITMEYCEAGSVEGIFNCLQNPLLEKEIAAICCSVLRALMFIHALPALHRDIKCGNILLTEKGEVKLGDFGVSAQLMSQLSRRNSFVGTTHWMAPEVIQEKDYDNRADIWSLGIAAIEMAELGPPLHNVHAMRVLHIIQRNPPPSLSNPHEWSANFNDFIAQCLVHNPMLRPSAEKLLQHPFISQSDPLCLVDLVLRYREKIRENDLNERPVGNVNFDDFATDSSLSTTSSIISIDRGAKNEICTLSHASNFTARSDSPSDNDDDRTIIDHEESIHRDTRGDENVIQEFDFNRMPLLHTMEDQVPFLHLESIPFSIFQKNYAIDKQSKSCDSNKACNLVNVLDRIHQLRQNPLKNTNTLNTLLDQCEFHYIEHSKKERRVFSRKQEQQNEAILFHLRTIVEILSLA